MGVCVKQIWSVGRVASWDGFCLPCGRDDRPLVLTRSGAAGLRAWLAGIGDDERTLLLTCRVCGEWQVVPLREEDDPEVVVTAEPAVAAVLAAAVAALPVTLPRQRSVTASRAVGLPGLAPLTLRSAPTRPAPPDAAAVFAARSVLSAARAGQRSGAARATSRPTSRPSQPARRRGHRRGPTPRRPDHAARKARPSAVPIAAATSIALPQDLLATGRSLLLAAG